MSNLNKFLKSFEESNENLFNNRDIDKELNNKDNSKINLKLNKKIKKENLEENENKLEINEEKIEVDLNLLFLESETPEQFREKWFDLYNKSQISDKKTITNQKVRNGRFRFNSTGDLEILSNFKTKGKSSNELLHESWNIK